MRKWHVEEDALLLDGKPVPGRSVRAIENRRRRLKLQIPRERMGIATAEPRPAYKSRREPPEWWDRAFRLNRQGLTVRQIQDRLGVSRSGVKYALDARERKRRKDKSGRTKPAPDIRDHKREMIRELARDKWDADGHVRSLRSYYREFDCE